MTAIISSRTPEGVPNRCPICKATVYLEPSEPLGDAPCPKCGNLLFFIVSDDESRLYDARAVSEAQRDELQSRLASDPFDVEDICEALKNAHGMELVDLSAEVPPQVISMVPVSMAQVYQIVPVDFREGVLTIALADPQNVNAIDDLRFMLNCHIEAVVADAEKVRRAIQRYYGTQ